MKSLHSTFAALVALAPALQAQPAQRPFQVDDLFRVKRVAEPQVAPTGEIYYQVGTVDMAANKVVNKVYVKRNLKAESAAGAATHEGQAMGEPLPLGDGAQAHPRLSPDGKRLAFETGGQIWIYDLAKGEKAQLTKLSGGAHDALWSPDGKWIAFASTTVPSGDDAENAAYLKAQGESKVQARTFDTLMMRHWTEWIDPKQVSHLFVVPADGSAAPKDLTAGFPHDVPNFADIAAGAGFAWSPDSKVLAFEAHPEEHKAVSTNGEIYQVAVAGGPVEKLSDNPAMDSTPRFSPDGKYLAWRAQRRPGYESDRWELWVMDRATKQVVATTAHFDRHVDGFQWDGDTILFEAAEAGREDLYRWAPLAGGGQGQPARLTKGLHIEGLALRNDRAHALISQSDIGNPPDLYEVDLKTGASRRVTFHNAQLTQELALKDAEDFWFTGAAGAKVHALVVKPTDWDPGKRYPVAFLIHGGPQGAWSHAWSHRWNAQTWTGRGFLTVMVNPRGSTGYGQAFTDQIRGDWDGLVMTDLMNGLDAVLKAYPNADAKRVVAAGGSYGGYAVNWIAGHFADRFAAFVSHAGIYNTESMQLASEELWFPHWEFKGWPWESAENRARWERMSPHRAAANFKKPMLVVHGEIDYRVPFTEGIQLFQTHQLMGIPSRFLMFPDEGHWILKPQNSRLWHTTVLDWADRWAK